MDISRDTIDKLGELQAAATRISWPEVETGELPAVAFPAGITVHSLEAYAPTRRQFRGTFTTRSVQSFVDYVTPFANHQACFIDSEATKASLWLDIGDYAEPGHCFHLAHLQLVKTALYTDILKSVDRAMTQREMAEWLDDWRACIANAITDQLPQDLSGEDYSVAKAIQAVRSIKIAANGQTTVTVGAMNEERSAFAQVSASSIHHMPNTFVMRCKPFEELTERDILLDVSVITGDTPKLKLRIRSFGTLQEEIAEEFASLLRAKLPEGIVPILGSFKP